MTKTKIPQFRNREEEAKWWDTHDITDYVDELKPVKVDFAKNLSEGLTIRLNSATIDKLRRIAQEKGIGPATLARMWIIEHLKEHGLVR